MKGKRALASVADREWHSTPKLLAWVIERRISLQRGGRGGEAQRADLLPVNGLAGLGFEPVEDGDRVLHQPGEVALAAELADEPGRVPGAAVGELRLLDQQHILRAGAAQMIGERSCRWRRRR